MIETLLGVPGKLKQLLDRITNSTVPLTDARVTKLDSIDATVSSRAAASTALSTATWTATKAGYLDVAVSSVGRKQKVQIFTASGTWTRPANVDAIEVVLVGGGQGGTGAYSGYNGSVEAGGGGGGGGQVLKRSLVVTGNVTVTIGAGGAGGVANASSGVTPAVFPGSNGGDSTLTVGATLTAKGGGTSGNGAGVSVTTDGWCGGGGSDGDALNGTIQGQTGGYHVFDIARANYGLSPGHISGTTALTFIANAGGKGIDGYGGGGSGGSVTSVTGCQEPFRGVDGGGTGAIWVSNSGRAGGNATANTGGGGGGASAVGTVGAGYTANGGNGADGICVIKWLE